MDLNKDIKLSSFGKKKNALPKKKSMNLYQPDYSNDPKRMIAICVVLSLIVIAVFARFVVIEKLNQINNLKAEISELQYQEVEIQTRLNGYNDLKEKYYRYSDSYEQGEEKLVDRITIMTLINQSCEGLATVTSTTITGNLVNLNIVTEDLDKVRELKNILIRNSLVTDVTVYNATRSTGDVISAISFSCVVNEDGE